MSGIQKKIENYKWIWIVIIFSILHFIVGACIKSDGPYFDPEKAYNIFNNTITLTAYFLAPAIAATLYSDWRLQHRALKNERVSSEIKFKLIEIIPYLNLYPSAKNVDIAVFNLGFNIILAKLRELKDQLAEQDEESIKFKTDLNNQIKNLGDYLETFNNQYNLNFSHLNFIQSNVRNDTELNKILSEINQADIERSKSANAFVDYLQKFMVLNV